MAYFKKEGGSTSRGGFGGGKKFGGPRTGGFKKPGFGGPRTGGFGGPARGGFSDGPREMFEAVCAECNTTTEVPFRPNGRKPVFCRDCFKKQEGEGEGYTDRPRFAVREPREERGSTSGTGAGRDAMLLEAISTKLDRVIRELEALKQASKGVKSGADAEISEE
ncbi:MAG: hypothetical protein RLZZ324_1297 [Candidatus Parcubacteria bacterium]|jgi:CxxC-x17-CxxC domain-containing protein